MSSPRRFRYKRTDIWREGRWVDLWSVVHLLSGTSIGLAIFFLHFGTAASVALVFLALVSYEMWEAMVRIKETPMNRVMDVVVGMFGFLSTFFFIAPKLSDTLFILVFGLIFTATVVMSVFGWVASQKAAELQARVRARYRHQRERIKEHAARLRARLRDRA